MCSAPARDAACVYLVGSGPGDPGLITARGLELLRRADVVVYDYLSSNGLLDEAPRDAERIYVGKQGYERHVTQDDINAVLVRKARELDARVAAGELAPAGGRASVVRLKGGDPFVFGRGGEEALALRAAGVPFEVVPGVTSGIAAPAYAGIPVTHRKVASSVTLVTGNEDPTRETSSLDWDALAGLARRGDTLCFYMGMRNLPVIADHLTARGVDARTPVALVRWGTTTRQTSLVSTLAAVVADAEAAGVTAPVMIVVGRVVALRDELDWFEGRPLFGRRVVVTRSRAQASDLTGRLRELGADVEECPAIEQVAPTSYAALDDALARLGRFDWVVFTSANGADAFFGRLATAALPAGTPADARALAGARVAAIGPATAAALRAHGIRADVVPTSYRAEAVFDAMRDAGLKAGEQVLIPRAEVAREALPALLREAGATVTVAPAYRTRVPDDDAARTGRLREELAAGEVWGITFTSSSTVTNLLGMLGDDAAGLIRASGARVFSIGPVTTRTLADHGLTDVTEAHVYTIAGLIDVMR